jgi:hypothetical protein
MGNHFHLMAICQDIEQMKNFYGELKKKLTDYYKRLAGYEHHDHLSLWEDITKVPQILDLEAAIARVAYIFANPSSADLVDNIEVFTGYSSWDAFIRMAPEIESCHEEETTWVRLPTIKRVSSLEFGKQEELEQLKELEAKNSIRHTIKIYPFAWLRVFGVTDSVQIEEVRQEIIKKVRGFEEASRQRRNKAGTRAIGAEKLRNEGINVNYKPKKHGPSYFCITSCGRLFKNYREKFNTLRKRGRECFKLMCMGVANIDWPLELFVPPRRRLANPLYQY